MMNSQLPSQDLLDGVVWGPEYREDTQYLHVFVRRLRAKLETDPTNPRYIIAMPGVGYQFKGLV